MKVETVIRDTQWFAESNPTTPDVSVLLYVGKRDVQKLARAVESLLQQPLTAIQLIVVDDTCDEQVSAWLEAAQRRIPHMGVLRHASVIGLPALGWIEAVQRARAPWILLAREIDRFNPDALDELLSEAQRDAASIVFGYVELVEHGDGGSVEVVEQHLRRAQSMVELRVGNFIPRNAVLIPRRAIDFVGFLDPHVVMASCADWDLWRRISECFEMKPLDLAIGVCEVQDSADGAVDIDLWAAEEWMRTSRNDRLILERIGDYDVLAPDPAHCTATREVCSDLASRWLDRCVPRAVTSVTTNADAEGHLLIVNVQYDASTALYFDMLPPPLAQRLRVVSHKANTSIEALAGATAVIIVRAVRSCQAWIDNARLLGIPVYYFLDDNMPLLAETGEALMVGEDFRPAALREDLKQFDGVLLSSPSLIEYFRHHQLHSRLLHFPVACATQDQIRRRFEALPRPAQTDELVFAFMGGLHRSKAVWDLILPALAQIASEGQRIHFITPGMKSDSKLLDGLPASIRVTLLPWDPGYIFALRRFASLSPQYLLLAPSRTPNNSYKTLHPLLTAHLVDAVAVLPAIDPYLGVDDNSTALIVEEPFERDSWYRVLRRIVDRQVDVESLKQRNGDFCANEFSGQDNVAVLREVIASSGGMPSWPLQIRRLRALATMREGNDLTHRQGSHDSWRRTADELYAMRHMRRYSWRHRILPRPSDLWDSCGNAFQGLQRDALKHGWRRPGSTLEFSDSLHALPSREYHVTLPAGCLGGIAFALAVDGPPQGTVVVELISSNGETVARATRELSRLDLNQPVRFMFDPVVMPERATWRVRLRSRSSVPVYVYEMINRRRLGAYYSPPTPFMELLPGTLKSASSQALASQSRRDARSGPLLNIKLVIEGDIPTNQIIERLLVEAVGTVGTVEKLLLSEFTPSTLFDGGLVIMSRTASPASLPMIEWMKAHNVPFAYYVDDNFWELEGDTPLVQFYKSAPVQHTLDLTVRDAKTVIVNAPRLGEYIKSRYPGADITLLNAPFDFSLVEEVPCPDRSVQEVRIGFAGSVTRAADFVEILPALRYVRDRYPNDTLTFFGYCPPELIGSERVTYVPHVSNYSEFIKLKASHRLDIGLAPMAASSANLYKTNNKYREYGALGIAGVYTNTSPYAECVADGETGLLVSHSVEAWRDALERLVVDRELRARIAVAAYEDVKTNYSQKVVALQWRVFLEGFAREHFTSNPCESATAVSIARLRARRWLAQTWIRVLVRTAGVRRRAHAFAHRITGERGQ
ncbi:hypothetical protein LMG22037_05738 [Paraburkholderia phenoliruptrix]|uniref:Glycosyltransferase 2-like domain-containing protein n=1 Tax=Paraburkholderia phenoliruptrix TaxID=252970 RepID=A0A6J5CEH0_9BURK|nr:glycosyltransferase [Paraburkholderia phenoliruptrix]CAB3732774.1 hypothetical protein LMG22037_05738 [Paraburkholderia phenoliruptrix]